jgi:regulator of RNase E activity RraA
MPVNIAGAQIGPGDLIHGDANGFVVIPDDVAGRVMDEVRKVREREGEMIHWINSPDFDLPGLRKRFGL